MVLVMMSYQSSQSCTSSPQPERNGGILRVGGAKEEATSAMQRRKQNGPPTPVKLLPMMSEAVFQQDGAPAHNAARTQEWCRANLPGFWEMGVGPGNSPDLSPIKNIWAIVQGELDKMEPATSEQRRSATCRRLGVASAPRRWTT